MYLPPHFEERRADVLQALLADHPLGLLITCDAAGLQANPVPFLFDAATTAEAPHGRLLAHVARSNPLWKDANDSEVLVVFQGPQAYVSPNWYASKAEHGKVVPTWNYCMAQARGRLRAIDDAVWLRALLHRLTDHHEAIQPSPWGVDDAPTNHTAQLLKAIVGIEIRCASLVGKWKVSQNRPARDRAGVSAGLRTLPSDTATGMADLVAQHPPLRPAR